MNAALVTVYLFTYNRNNLLPRAIKSLLDQTLTNWRCELHNDNPDDPYPQALANQLNDSRITVINHPVNLGPTASFNLAYRKVNSKYVSVLEDDNWWEPDFLKTMVDIMESHPDVFVAWSNMRYWQEHEDGTWEDTQKSIWEAEKRAYVKFTSLKISQLHGAVHSNGAMLVRTNRIEKYVIPETTWFDFVESVRERVFDYPILFVNQPLANFANTLSTSRTKDNATWNAWQVMLVGSFLSSLRITTEDARKFWMFASKHHHSSIHYFIAAFYYRKLWKLVIHAPLRNLIFFIGYYVKNFKLFIRTIQKIKENKELKSFIDVNTNAKLQHGYLRFSDVLE